MTPVIVALPLMKVQPAPVAVLDPQLTEIAPLVESEPVNVPDCPQFAIVPPLSWKVPLNIEPPVCWLTIQVLEQMFVSVPGDDTPTTAIVAVPLHAPMTFAKLGAVGESLPQLQAAREQTNDKHFKNCELVIVEPPELLREIRRQRSVVAERE
jgi:hypothetical protein